MPKKISIRKTISIPPLAIRLDMATFLPEGRYPARIQYELYDEPAIQKEKVSRVKIGVPRFLLDAMNLGADGSRGGTLFVDVTGDYLRFGGQWPIV